MRHTLMILLLTGLVVLTMVVGGFGPLLAGEGSKSAEGAGLMLLLILEDARSTVDVVEADQALALHRDGEAVFLDCRGAEAFKMGHVRGAVNIPRGRLEFRCEHELPDLNARVVVYSQREDRSLLAAQTLQCMGYGNVVVLSGGYDRWHEEGNPEETGE